MEVFMTNQEDTQDVEVEMIDFVDLNFDELSKGEEEVVKTMVMQRL